MWKIQIKFPFMEYDEVFYFDSLIEASKELKISLYFLRQVYNKKHRNQFAKSFTVTPVTKWVEASDSE
tara:strand:+ start:271 stop:474 length:204 start_codon:yes stop_codon:yes gene_type:complete